MALQSFASSVTFLSVNLQSLKDIFEFWKNNGFQAFKQLDNCFARMEDAFHNEDRKLCFAVSEASSVR